jgi:Esterase-like activity of phytase
MISIPFAKSAVLLLLPAVLAAQSVDLTRRGTFASNVVAGSEIVAHDPTTQRMFVTNGAANRIDAINISNVDAPTLVFFIDVSALGSVNSVAVKNGLLAAAIASNTAGNAGVIAVYGTDGMLRRSFPAGVLPDHVSFSPNGNLLLSANEGEPIGTVGQPTFVDPPGSITLINLSSGVDTATVTQIGFTSFDGRENELRARGVRIFPTRAASVDLEPEYIAVSPDSARAFVTLQEANAFAVLDLTTNTVVDIVAAGLKDHSRGLPQIETANFPELPVLGMTPAMQTIRLGGFSGLWFEGVEGPTGRLRFATIPDRGPNGEPTNVDADPALERPFALPAFQPRVVRFTYDPVTKEIALGQQLLLTRADGSAMTGLPNIAALDEQPVDLFGAALAYDPLGADLEGLVIAPNGDYWMVDEYRPAIYRFNSLGSLQARYVPAGTAALAGQAVGTFGTETLPAEYSTRRANRGFEGMALDTDSGILYAFIQTPLANPNLAASNSSKVIRMLGINPSTGAVVSEYVYPMDKTVFREQNTDKIGDAMYAGNGRFYVVERDDSILRSGKKMLFQFSLIGATNLRAAGAPALLAGLTLEQHSLDQLAQAGIRPVSKIKVANLPSLGYFEGDKLEGMALLGDGQLALLNDNDFGIEARTLPTPPNGSIPLETEATPIQLGIVRFAGGAGLDASDRDGPANGPLVNIANWPIYGMHMPDSIASFSANGATFYASAGEGDDRGEVARIGSASFALDAQIFTSATALRTNAQLGRLNASLIDGNLDADPEFEQLQVLGSRSVNIWDQFGNLVFDSGDILEQQTNTPLSFNSDH